MRHSLSLLGLLVFSISIIPDVNAAPFELVKSEISDAVYYIDQQDIRYPFPNLQTYQSWYGKDFSKVITISNELLATYRLGHAITIKSGSVVKVPSAPEVYTVEPGGLLREIEREDLAQHFYGDDWNKRVIDIPEVFFKDYTIGNPIKSGSDVPNGVVYKLSGEETLYWKDRDVLTRFADRDALRANNLENFTPIIADRSFFTRNHIISGKEQYLFTPSYRYIGSTADCNDADLQAGLIYLHEGALSDNDLANLVMIRDEFPTYWSARSNKFSSIQFPFPIHLVEVDNDNRITNEYGRFEVTHEIGFDYYEHFNDTVDFLIIFTDFNTRESDEAFFSPVTQSLQGVGKQRLDRSALFGSQGKLKGIVVMGNINTFTFSIQRQVDSLYNSITHELLHNWSGALSFLDNDNTINSSLLSEDGNHWSPWVSFTSPLGGKGWHANGNDTNVVDETLSSNLARDFHQLDLYAMGLYPAQLVDPVGYIATAQSEPHAQSTSNPLITVTIEQIIAANGNLRCILP